MRKGINTIIESFKNNTTKKVSNDTVTIEGESVVWRFWGNPIVRKNINTGIVEINNCGYNTNSTKERLVAVGANICQKNFVWFKDGEPMKDNVWIKL